MQKSYINDQIKLIERCITYVKQGFTVSFVQDEVIFEKVDGKSEEDTREELNKLEEIKSSLLSY